MPNKVEFNKNFPTIKKSDEYYKIALDLIPAQTQTLAKGTGQNIKGVAPKFLQKGKGSHVWDVDGNEYIDYTMGVGPLSLGYAYDKVDEAIKEQLKDGITFSMPHPLEVEVAELIHKVVPNAESIRYARGGADVVSGAVRVARAYTGRSKVLCCGYHGWHDWYISVTDRNKGIPQEIQNLTYTFNYNDIQSVIDSIDDDTACVVLEPFVFEEPKDNFLQKLRDVCTKNGTVLVFDEMWTGFRVALGGAQQYFGVKADLACFSKAVANGMPLSILTGKKEIMSLLDKEVFFFNTFGGEALSLAAAKATINEMIDKNVQAYLAKQGNKLKTGYNKIAEKLGMNFTKCSGFDCRTIITFDGEKSGCNPLEMKSLVQQEMIKRGILWGGFHNMSFSHSDEDIDYTLKAYEDVLPILKNAVEEKDVKKYLKGEPLEPVFRKVGNFNIKPKKK
ncbi:MAG TPA: aminotransferase class III-fold pyridoxal phosphate-dependent enzyme [Ignavibacteriaceae bacterium]|jgi:glutamate-1-semialdehyde aminotransferase|nr:MAG: 3-aminobutyryl-CoA aminotransferase [Ignavibacteria bacterium ADurb.Bin266]OQY75544.1 MAG: aspartate aminotransferase family protein [Ignavibacteriales bacterium UTCHB2]HQF43634.1 aminotransferase class III-fold pyridoxal phosphate-dependent enzyme [Ignavibacteriaceae bacterium]HQI41803.1 aminotransferase class III-fold pyridoxal phosphate-dependent enzyme [Ignavibacteriaceae bacterium]HQJ46470.1 aminotransferase class III-fold pyridoxal phosphate-dependent enzyme [Ignavibacteriaceae ba